MYLYLHSGSHFFSDTDDPRKLKLKKNYQFDKMQISSPEYGVFLRREPFPRLLFLSCALAQGFSYSWTLYFVRQITMPSNPKKGKTLKCTENLKEFYENEDEFKFPEGGSLKQSFVY